MSAPAPMADNTNADDTNADDANAPVADDGNIVLPNNGVSLSVLRLVEPPVNFKVCYNIIFLFRANRKLT